MRRLTFLLVALVLLGSACSTFGTAPAATVNGTEITSKSITDEMKAIRGNPAYVKAIEASFGPVNGSGRSGTFDAAFAAQLLTLRVIYTTIEKDLDRRGVKVGAQDLAQARQQMTEQFASTGGKGFGTFPKAYQDTLIRQTALFDLFNAQIAKDLGADPKAFFDANKDEFAEICVSHAFAGVQDGKSADEARAKAQAWYDAIQSGEKTFEEIATNESEDPGAAQQAGSLGCGSKLTLQLDPTFLAAAFSLEQGVVSEPVQTQFGSHLIRVTSRTVPTYDEVASQVPTVMDQVHNERARAALLRLLCDGKISVNPRFGTWTSETCDGPGQSLPTVRAPEGPAGGSTTTSVDPAQG